MRKVTPVDMSGKTARFRRDVIITAMDETGIPRLQPWECQGKQPQTLVMGGYFFRDHVNKADNRNNKVAELIKNLSVLSFERTG